MNDVAVQYFSHYSTGTHLRFFLLPVHKKEIVEGMHFARIIECWLGCFPVVKDKLYIYIYIYIYITRDQCKGVCCKESEGLMECVNP